MKKSLCISVLICFLGSVLSAQPNQTDKTAQEILKGVSNKYKSFKSVKATFIITVENQTDKSKDTRQGTIYLKGNKYKLEIANQDVICDGKTRWTYVKDANEVQIDNQKTDENAITPSTIFTMYEKGWLFKFEGERTEKEMTYQLVELIPVDPKKKNVFKVKLTINKNDKFITSASVFDRNGNIQTITVDKLSPDVIYDDTLFSFNSGKYPGAEIVDLR